MANRRIRYQTVKRYIGGKQGKSLRKELQRDYRKHRFSREADVEVCTCYHLRKFLKPDDRWHVFAEAFRGKIGGFPDITVVKLRGHRRRIVMELKWWAKKGIPEISGKDRRTLDKFIKKRDGNRDAQMAYFVRVLKPGQEYKKLGSRKEDFEKYRLKELPILLGLQGAPLKRWKRDRERIRQELK